MTPISHQLPKSPDAEALAAWLLKQGYSRTRVLPDGSVAGILDLIYTRALCLGVNEQSWTSRFCFDDAALADQRFAELASELDEPAGYIARRGRGT